MILTGCWCICVLFSVFCGILSGQMGGLTSGLLDGASAAVTVSISIAGPLALWSGLSALLERTGLTGLLSRLLMPLLGRLFPACRSSPELAHALCGNVCANLLGLGNAATPLGIQAARLLRDPAHPDWATDQLCRLVVMNTASIQLLPTTVAALRSAAGCAAPFDILPCVWVSSLLSLSAGLTAARFLEKLCP